MIKSVIAYTTESVDGDKAAAELLSQFAVTENMFGLIYCNSEFVAGGIIEKCVEKLPFECIGVVSSAHSSISFRDAKQHTISVVVLYGEQSTRFCKVAFGDASTEPVRKFRENAEVVLPSIANRLPAVVLMYAGFMPNLVSGSELVRSVSGFFYDEVPVFGMVANNTVLGGDGMALVLDGGSYSAHGLAALVIYDTDVRPTFYYAGVPEEKIVNDGNVITECCDTVIKTIDWKPATEFFFNSKMKYVSERDISYLSRPLVFQTESGKTVLNLLSTLDDNSGTLTFTGDVVDGSEVGWGTLDDGGVKAETTRLIHTLENVAKSDSLVLIYDCSLRQYCSGDNHCANLAWELLHCKHVVACTNGEFCPVERGRDGRWENYAQSGTVIAMVL